MHRKNIDHPYGAVRRELRFAVGYTEFTRALESLLGRLDPAGLVGIGRDTPDRAREKLARMAGVSGFTLVQKIDHGAISRSLATRHIHATTYVFGNALIASDMTKLDPRVGLYDPPRLYVCETKTHGVLVTYDLPSATLAQFDSPAINGVAASLDAKVEKLVAVAAALADKTRSRPRRPVMAESGRR